MRFLIILIFFLNITSCFERNNSQLLGEKESNCAMNIICSLHWKENKLNVNIYYYQIGDNDKIDLQKNINASTEIKGDGRYSQTIKNNDKNINNDIQLFTEDNISKDKLFLLDVITHDNGILEVNGFVTCFDKNRKISIPVKEMLEPEKEIVVGCFGFWKNVFDSKEQNLFDNTKLISIIENRFSANNITEKKALEFIQLLQKSNNKKEEYKILTKFKEYLEGYFFMDSILEDEFSLQTIREVLMDKSIKISPELLYKKPNIFPLVGIFFSENETNLVFLFSNKKHDFTYKILEGSNLSAIKKIALNLQDKIVLFSNDCIMIENHKQETDEMIFTRKEWYYEDIFEFLEIEKAILYNIVNP